MGSMVPVVMDGVRVFESQTACANWLARHEGLIAARTSISQCLAGRLRTYHGHTFEAYDPRAERMAALEDELGALRAWRERAEDAMRAAGRDVEGV